MAECDPATLVLALGVRLQVRLVIAPAASVPLLAETLIHAEVLINDHCRLVAPEFVSEKMLVTGLNGPPYAPAAANPGGVNNCNCIGTFSVAAVAQLVNSKFAA